MKYASYFLIVSDYIKWAKNNDIPVGPGRGSGAGSLVAWCLSITDVDPIKFNLIFERFLNPDRISMPDFDIDFCEDKRDLVFEYLTKKYKDSVADLLLPSTQFDMYSAENAGLIKFDFLGLKTLTVINNTQKLIKKINKDFDIEKIDFEDQKVFDLLSSGKTVGLFQIESAGMREALLQMKPNHLEDIIALVALYRPGPMSNIPTYISNQNKLSEFYEELKRLNVEVVRPDINECFADFRTEDGKFYYALGGIKAVGYEAISNIIEERSANGKFSSIDDFLNRVNPKDINKLQLEGLVKAGAFDCLNDNRQSLFNSIPNFPLDAISTLEDVNPAAPIS